MCAWDVVSGCVPSCRSVTVDSVLFVVVSSCSLAIVIVVVEILNTGVVETGG